MDGMPPVARRLEPQARREQILAGAVAYFAEVGFGGTTRDLASRIGITQALLYRYFASKADLMEAVFERVFLGRLSPRWGEEIRDRTQPLLPMGLGYVEGVTHDTIRHGRPHCLPPWTWPPVR